MKHTRYGTLTYPLWNLYRPVLAEGRVDGFVRHQSDTPAKHSPSLTIGQDN